MSQNETDYSDLLLRLEEWTRGGQSRRVAQVLRDLKFTKIPRLYCYKLAEIARRIDEPLLSLKMMNPIIRSSRLLDEKPTAKEKIVYATSLISAGFLHEAHEILADIDESEEPEVLLYRSFAHFGEWNYERAIPLLKRFVKSSKIADYTRVVGQVNLAAALVSEAQTDPAIHLLTEIIKETRDHGYDLLHGNALELMAQVCVIEKQYMEATRHLSEADRLLSPADNLYSYFVKKWQRIVELLQDPDSQDKRLALEEFSQKAAARGYWEVVRDCDLFRSMACRDDQGLRHVLAGTPYLSYHRRAERILGHKVPTSLVFDRCFGLPPAEKVFDPRNLADEQARDLAFHPVLIKAMTCLSRDFYKPLSLGQFFFEVFGDQYFDPHSSEQRTINCVHRLRLWLRSHRWPFEVRVRRNTFYLYASEAARLRVYRKRFNQYQSFLDAYHQVCGPKSFSTAHLTEHFKISRQLAVQVIRHGLSVKRIQALSAGRSRRYRFSNHR